MKEALRELRNLVHRICVLSHGQAAVERGFNVNKETIVLNQVEDSLIAQRRVFDAIRDVEDLSDVQISKKMLVTYRGASRRRKEFLARLKEKESEQEKKKKAAKRALDQIRTKEGEMERLKEELETKMRRLNEDIDALKKS